MLCSHLKTEKFLIKKYMSFGCNRSRPQNMNLMTKTRIGCLREPVAIGENSQFLLTGGEFLHPGNGFEQMPHQVYFFGAQLSLVRLSSGRPSPSAMRMVVSRVVWPLIRTD